MALTRTADFYCLILIPVYALYSMYILCLLVCSFVSFMVHSFFLPFFFFGLSVSLRLAYGIVPACLVIDVNIILSAPFCLESC